MSEYPVVVVGGSGHIGSGVVEVLAEDGWQVVAVDILPPRQKTDSVVYQTVNAASEDELISLCDDIAQMYGGIAGLVNCGGLLRQGTVVDMEINDWDLVMEVNVKTVFLAIRAFAELLKASSPATVVNISSVSAHVASTGGFAYSTSKGAILSLTSSLAGEFAAFGVRVVSVCPGWVDGGFTEQVLAGAESPDQVLREAEQSHLLGELVSKRDIGYAVSFLISKRARMITGSHLYVDGGFHVKR